MNDAWSLDDAATGRDPKYREIAILIDHSAAVRLWLDRSGTRPRGRKADRTASTVASSRSSRRLPAAI